MVRTISKVSRWLLLSILFFGSQAPLLKAAQPESPREKILLDRGWRFALGNAKDPEKDFHFAAGFFSYLAKTGYGDGPAAKDFDDRSWRIVDLPHDWAVELPFDVKGGSSHGFRAIGRNFPENSVGWYRKAFQIPASDLGRRISLRFDGVHRDAVVFVNGFYLGRESDGYSGFAYDVSDYLNYGGDNVVSVRADATLEEGWFYEGAGIYRHVWLEKTSPLHLERDGTFVAEKIKGDAALVSADSAFVNEGTSDQTFRVRQEILDPKGVRAGVRDIPAKKIGAGASLTVSCVLPVPHPKLWSPESPALYHLKTTAWSGKKIIDETETTFGLRTITFDPNQGMFLNGKHVEIKGVCMHQDQAGVGVALPDALQEFRVRRLKEMGCNAIRCSHNPPTPELLDVCDKLGLFVLPENRLMGVTPELLDRLQRMIRQDRNHPCVFAWSLGNEEWGIEGNEKGERIAATMQTFARRFDPTRLYTAAISGGWGQGISKTISLMGYNYYSHGSMDGQHRKYPAQPSLGTEETDTHATRGIYFDDKPLAHEAPTDREPEGSSLETSWKYYLARPYLAGLFYWTGFDYRGEPTPFGFPAVSSQFGILDSCGFPKDSFYYLKSWWTQEPVLHIGTHWNWKGREGQPIPVWVQTNCPEVELFLNGKSLGRKTLEANSHLTWSVPYEPGILKALGTQGGKKILEDSVETTGEAVSLELSADRTNLQADGTDVSVVEVRARDVEGRLVPLADNEAVFSLEGPGKIIGMGNGDPSCHESDQSIDQAAGFEIKNLRMKKVEDLINRPEVQPGYDDSHWAPAFPDKPNWDGKVQNEKMNLVVRGDFNLDSCGPSSKITLFAKSIGEIQSLYINGKLVAENIKRDQAGQAYLLDPKILHPGKNLYAMAGTPLLMRWDWDFTNRDPGLVQVFTPKGVWERSLFNGSAQVLVQAGEEPGEIILQAESKGLAPARLKLQAGN